METLAAAFPAFMPLSERQQISHAVPITAILYYCLKTTIP
jgi:hypothetical protein